MKCQKCGTEIQDGLKSCPNCGNEIKNKKSSTMNKFKHDISNVWPEWELEKMLGRGSYGVVYQAIRQDNKVKSQAAIKIISVPSDYSEVDSLRSEGLDLDGTRTYFKGIVDDFVKEIQVMESLKGMQNIVSIEDYKVVEKTDSIGWNIYIRMELLTPFNTYICDKTLNEADVIKLGCDICSALEICEKLNVVHRDIKPENIFINDFGCFKLGDFGVARKLENLTGGLSQRGTFNYMAPEVANNKGYDERADIYSLGIVLYRLLNNNKLPFINTEKQLLSPNERKNALERRFRGEELPAPCNASPEMSDLILRACAFNPDFRFKSATDMKEALTDVANGRYIVFDTNLDKTTSVRTAQTNYDATTSVRRATLPKVEEPKQDKTIKEPKPIEDKKELKVKSSSIDKEPKKANKKLKKLKITAISVISVLIVIAVACSVVVFSSPAYDVYKEVKANNISNALNGYQSEIKDSFVQRTIFNALLKNYIKRITSNSKNGETNFDSLLNDVKEYNELGAYKEAVNLIDIVLDMLPKDIETSELIKAREESFSLYKESILNEVENLISKKEYSDAIDLISETCDANADQYFKDLKSSTEKRYLEYITQTVEDYMAAKSYDTALRAVNEALMVLPNNYTLKQLKEKVENSIPAYLVNVLEPFESTACETIKESKTVMMGGVERKNGFYFNMNGNNTVRAVYNLNKKYTNLSGLVGYVDGTCHSITRDVEIYLDDKWYSTISISPGDLPKEFSVDLTGVQKIEIKVVNFWNTYVDGALVGFAEVEIE